MSKKERTRLFGLVEKWGELADELSDEAKRLDEQGRNDSALMATVRANRLRDCAWELSCLL